MLPCYSFGLDDSYPNVCSQSQGISSCIEDMTYIYLELALKYWQIAFFFFFWWWVLSHDQRDLAKMEEKRNLGLSNMQIFQRAHEWFACNVLGFLEKICICIFIDGNTVLREQSTQWLLFPFSHSGETQSNLPLPHFVSSMGILDPSFYTHLVWDSSRKFHIICKFFVPPEIILASSVGIRGWGYKKPEKLVVEFLYLLEHHENQNTW